MHKLKSTTAYNETALSKTKMERRCATHSRRVLDTPPGVQNQSDVFDLNFPCAKLWVICRAFDRVLYVAGKIRLQ